MANNNVLVESKLVNGGATIFSVMLKLASEHQVINLGWTSRILSVMKNSKSR